MAEHNLDKDWEEFKVKYERDFTPEEEVKRKEIFTKFWNRMHEHNAGKDGKPPSYILGINQFSDREEHEYKAGRTVKHVEVPKDS